MTAPLATLARLADRPGELAGLGPVDPWLTRDLAVAAARNPRTTWCVTVGLYALTLTGGRICAMTRFDNSVLPWFGLPRSLPIR